MSVNNLNQATAALLFSYPTPSPISALLLDSAQSDGNRPGSAKNSSRGGNSGSSATTDQASSGTGSTGPGSPASSNIDLVV